KKQKTEIQSMEKRIDQLKDRVDKLEEENRELYERTYDIRLFIDKNERIGYMDEEKHDED
ncbi:MAG: hypothetical protein PUC46_07690, partial [Lachnospiraceae bacterium]|nr:hypothetical protein [Lachnospiraceae bacterium]